MNTRIISWIPRLLIVIVITLFAVFSLDCFGTTTEVGIQTQTSCYVMQLVPTYILAGILILSFYKMRLAGFLLLVLGLFTIIFFRTYQNILVFFIVSLPILTSGWLLQIQHKK